MEARASLEAVLDSIAQPVWVLDHEGIVRFVNPAALAALGYDDASELQGKFGHDAIHYKDLDGSPYPAATRTTNGGSGLRGLGDRVARWTARSSSTARRAREPCCPRGSR